ncbi:MAG: hypothetical protein S4CHLAM102_09130 [Chlamydiia bacterium]|nr:hypothetical protein [Chlamydiia bacterium]
MGMASVFTIADLHLAGAIPDKRMDVFPGWEDYTPRLRQGWLEKVNSRDLVLIGGDISWALHLDEVLVDLNWIESMPGTKLILKGNHDLWWNSKKKVEAILPPSIHLLQNDAYHQGRVAIGGTRLWDCESIDYTPHINFVPPPKGVHVRSEEEAQGDKQQCEKIFARELCRLDASLSQMNASADVRIAMTHYPPCSYPPAPSPVTPILKKHNVDICIFGHIHSLKKEFPTEFEFEGIRYICASADHLGFIPYPVCQL